MRSLRAEIHRRFVQNLYRAMKGKNLRYNNDLARKLGLSPSTLKGWLNEEKLPQQKYLDMLNQYFGVDNLYWLEGGSERA